MQRAIADELGLTQQVAADFDRQDEEDDFAGVDQGSRAEIGSVARVIATNTAQHRCLVVFHNSSNEVVDLTSCGIVLSRFLSTKVLWTFGGRFRFTTREITQNLDKTSLVLGGSLSWYPNWNSLVAAEAREVALYTRKHGAGGVTPEIATECCLYLLSLHHDGERIIDYNWVTHAASYWVCDGIIGGGGGQLDNQAWELARDLQQQMRLECYSSGKEALPYYVFCELRIPHRHWTSTVNSHLQAVPPGTTSLFFAPPQAASYSLPSDRFLEADQLRVLKLCHCTFSFSSPPFHCCHNLRFLGLDNCKDEEQQQGAGGARAVETFQRLWVLDVCHTDWQLDFPLETEARAEDKLAASIREVHINKGRIWRSNVGLAWRRLPSLRRLRVVDPTSPWWETGSRGDEFVGMVNLEQLDLSGNSTMRVLPSSLSTATSLKTLVLDGCVGLEFVVGPQAGGLPPSLQSFSLDIAGSSGDDQKKNNEASRISCINLSGCARLSDFRLRGPLPKLEELDLSHTAVKSLRSHFKLNLCLSSLSSTTTTGQVDAPPLPKPSAYHDDVCIIIQQIAAVTVTQPQRPPEEDFHMEIGEGVRDAIHLHFCPRLRHVLPLSSTFALPQVLETLHILCCGDLRQVFPVEKEFLEKKASSSLQQICEAKMFAPNLETIYIRGCWGLRRLPATEKKDGRPPVAVDCEKDWWGKLEWDGKESGHHHSLFQPRHCSYYKKRHLRTTVLRPLQTASDRQNVPPLLLLRTMTSSGLKMNLCLSSSSSTTTTTGQQVDAPPLPKPSAYHDACIIIQQIAVVTVTQPQQPPEDFHTEIGEGVCDSSSNVQEIKDGISSVLDKAIHLHFCPRLRHVLPLSSTFALPEVLETLHILCCGDLRQLKVIYLHDLPNLQQICEAKMFAPNLETIYIRGCWSLRRLPATTEKKDDRPPVAVDCEKDWWDKLEWDGVESSHHPSLFQPHHSRYYKKRHLRTTVLRH
ncbi:hypothetical protein U9M48_040853 [Paspalum notatum var. saurae]|uniref:Uncharacterized protein n=1 Tax=Paspalum notatum var. saurae TaxID=547442 RepID=A0AAQ3URG4_PASNO